MKVTEHEMRGLLAGKCIPGDMKVNEVLPAYLGRKFAELHEQVQQLAAENAALKSGAEKVYDEITSIHSSNGWSVSEDGESNTAVIDLDGAQFVVQENLLDVKTPATDTWLNEVRAQGLDMFANKCSEKSKQAISSDTRDNWWLCVEHADDFAAQLRAVEVS